MRRLWVPDASVVVLTMRVPSSTVFRCELAIGQLWHKSLSLPENRRGGSSRHGQVTSDGS
jgi:hypothetical protein